MELRGRIAHLLNLLPLYVLDKISLKLCLHPLLSSNMANNPENVKENITVIRTSLTTILTQGVEGDLNSQAMV